MRSVDRSPRRRLRPSDRRAELLAAAAAAFADAPYADVSISEIAASVGASPALVHHHFGGKRELYLAVLRAASDDLRRRLGLATAPGGAAVDGGGDNGGGAVAAGAATVVVEVGDLGHDGVGKELEVGISAFVDFVAERRAGWAALYRGRIAADPQVRAVVDEVRSDVLDALRVGVRSAGYQDGPVLEIALRGYLGFVDEACLALAESPPDRALRGATVRAASAALVAALATVGHSASRP